MYADGARREDPLHLLDVDGQWGALAIFSYVECSSMRKIRDFPRNARSKCWRFFLPAASRIQRTGADAESVADFYGRAGAHAAAQTLNKGFSAAAVDGLRPQVEAIVDRMLKPLQRGSEVELMQEFANPMPVRIILEMIGIPQELHDTSSIGRARSRRFAAIRTHRGSRRAPRKTR